MNRLRISSKHYEQVRAHLFPGDDKEAVAVALCGVNQHKDIYTLSVMEVLPIPYSACSIRTSVRVTWQTEIINSFLKRAAAENLSILKIHCHPGGGEAFSEYDDISDYELFEHTFAWTQNENLQASCIMLPGGRIFGRFFGPDLLPKAIDRIAVAGPEILEWSYDLAKPIDEALQKRNLQAFGKGTIDQISRMKIGVVGCSGTGSPVIEQLKRYGVGHMVVVDPDYIDLHNLNRIISSTMDDAVNKVNKTEIIEREIKKVGFGTTVTSFAKNIVNREVVKELSTCDLLFGCFDGVEGRHVLNLISSYYLIPVIDLGVKLDADKTGYIDGIYGSIHFITPGSSSLLSRGQYTIQELEAESFKRFNKEAYERNQYLAVVNEDTPAVITINMLVAAYAVNEMLARIHKYRFIENSEADAIRIHFHLGKTFLESHPVPCQFFSKNLGRGDVNNLLDYIELGNNE
ncbi:MAG: ThiF family adenylyltransferase [Sphingobacteriales bacterium]|nr:ThiF family adenylyltransferase [Sphingobacteriales bacterium]OJY89316.1 MAG: hypothetical protein BGP14_05275 [Sphingobacteriales bacterium 44-15]